MFGYDAPRLHAALNDLPAALVLVAVLFDLGAWVTKRESLKAAALWTLWAGVIGGWAAVIAGLIAEDAIEHGEAIHDLMERHENLALITMGLFTLVLGWKLLRRARLTPIEELALRGASVVGLIGIMWVGAIGGQLVFEHAAGIKSDLLKAELRDREASDSSGRGPDHEHAPGAPEHDP